MRLFIVLFLLFVTGSSVWAKNYEPFVVDTLGETIYEGVFTGNGLLGTMTYLTSDKGIRIDVGRTDVYDHRKVETDILFDRARLPIGHFEIVLMDAHIVQANGVMSMQEADAVAIIETSQGALRVKTVTLSEKDIILVDIDKRNFQGNYTIRFVPEISQSPRMLQGYVKGKPENYLPNPTPVIGRREEINFIDQRMLAGGGYATAYKTIENSLGDILIATVAYHTTSDKYLKEAVSIVEKFAVTTIPQELEKHQQWWKTYLGLSTYQIPDERLQKFYDMQMYKFGCLTRSNRPAIDLQGPWTSATPWPAYWMNLNIQLTYSPLYTANRLDIAQSLINMLNTNAANLIQNVHPDYRHNSAALGRSSDPFLNLGKPLPLHLSNLEELAGGDAELSNLTWALLYYYQHYRYSMNLKLKEPLYALLKRSVNYAVHFLGKNETGQYELKVRTHSPEYPQSYDFNTNYDLASLRWGLLTLLELGNDNTADEQYLDSVRYIYDNLIDYPKDENGFMISSNQSYAVSHRHYSHLMMIYPYHLVDIADVDTKALVLRSIEHWQSKTAYLQGYSLSGAASMYAMLGDGDKAIRYLSNLNQKFIQPNTLYKESGPVIETPLAMAASLQELSLQFWNGTVRVFPAIPKAWKDVSFQRFRTDGAFLLSAVKTNGITESILVESEHGGTISLVSDQPMAKVQIEGEGKIIKKDGTRYEVYLERKSKLILTN